MLMWVSKNNFQNAYSILGVPFITKERTIVAQTISFRNLPQLRFIDELFLLVKNYK